MRIGPFLTLLGALAAVSACRRETSRPSGRGQPARTGPRARPSGDSAAGLREKLRHLDEGALAYIRKLDGRGLLEYRKRTGITICGIRPIAILLETLKRSGLPVQAHVLAYYTSGDVTGDWTNTVSYYSIAFTSSKGRRAAQTAASPATSEREASRGRVRPMGTGMGWYPKSGPALRRLLENMLGQVGEQQVPGTLVGLVSPHAGYAFSGRAAAHGYALLSKDSGVRRVVVLGPSHHVPFRGISVPDASGYATPLGPMPVDPVARAWVGQGPFVEVPRAHMREHSIEMQVPFLKVVAPKARFVPLLVGAVSWEEIQLAADRLVGLLDGRTVIVASSDFTHRGPRYGYRPFAGRSGPR